MKTPKITDLAQFAIVLNDTGFTPLPPEEHEHFADDRCCCPYCSADRNRSEHVPSGVWDTRATNLTTGDTYLVHYPELHHRPARRESF